MSPSVSRTLTIIAASLLAFDGAAMALMGWWGRRFILGLVGIVFFLSSGLVLLYWRWYRGRLDDISAARRALGEEARQMRELVRDSER